MAYAPAIQPAPAEAAPVGEMKAPPTIESHGGKMTPVTCFGCGPDGVTSLLMMLALLSTLAPRALKLFGRLIKLPMTRPLPGLILLAMTGWNLIPSLATYVDPHRQAYALSVGDRLWPVAGFLVLMIVGEGLSPPAGQSRWRSLAGLASTGLGLVVMAFTVQTVNYGFGEPRDPSFGLGSLIGLPIGLAILWLWRRYPGPLFSVIVVASGIGGFFLVEALGPWGIGQAWLGLEATAFTVAAAVGAALLGWGAPAWQNLPGRAVWAFSWALRTVVVVIASISML